MYFRDFFSNITLPFLGIWRKSVVISVFLFFCSLVILFFNGLNLGIDFLGGSTIDVRILEPAKISEVQSVLKNIGIKDGVVQRFFDSRDISIKIKSRSSRDVSIVRDALSKFYGDKFQYLSSDYIGAQFAGKQVVSSIFVFLIAIFAIFLYLCVRFDVFFGISGVVSLLHDGVLSLSFVSVTGLEFNLSIMAAILTIIGYSINDSVVIFDKIRFSSGAKSIVVDENILHKAINSTLSRTLLTSATTLLSSLPIIIFCSGSVRDFSAVVFFGICVGTLSSIFISAPMLMLKGININIIRHMLKRT